MATAILTLDSFDAKGNGHAKVSVIRSLNATTGRFDFGEYLDAEDGNAFEDSEVSYRLTEGKVYSVHASLSGTRFDRYYATVYQGKIVKLDQDAARLRLGTRLGNTVVPYTPRHIEVEED